MDLDVNEVLWTFSVPQCIFVVIITILNTVYYSMKTK